MDDDRARAWATPGIVGTPKVAGFAVDTSATAARSDAPGYARMCPDVPAAARGLRAHRARARRAGGPAFGSADSVVLERGPRKPRRARPAARTRSTLTVDGLDR
ncbi:hypothetical protein E4F39_14945 [Burkholderia pseudomallei]|nr:hypothetical protein [Burkholderia pseudomallei]MPT69980.1 hypothetical protein [Burkholderia pseudomallei]MPT76922.1 hypothetical protein [Burkholderia pseudomallei]MPT85216.1 hypothetical protein [Burkholderia pseudomallei]MPT91124.1 hypothetical protein [Burkholderia pseudomallei]